MKTICRNVLYKRRAITFIGVCLLVIMPSLSKSAGPYEISWYTIDGGGGPSYGVYGSNTNVNSVQGVSTNGFAGYFDSPRSYFSGNVGIGTTSPAEKLHVSEGQLRIDYNNGQGIELVQQNGRASDIDTWGNDLRIVNFATGDIWFSTGTLVGEANLRLIIKNDGNVGIGRMTPKGKLDVNGSIYQRGGQLHADYVFEPGYELESIEEHAEFMWTNRRLKAIQKAEVDENGTEVLEVGFHRKGVVEELEKAHIYIEQLHK